MSDMEITTKLSDTTFKADVGIDHVSYRIFLPKVLCVHFGIGEGDEVTVKIIKIRKKRGV